MQLKFPCNDQACVPHGAFQLTRLIMISILLFIFHFLCQSIEEKKIERDDKRGGRQG